MTKKVLFVLILFFAASILQAQEKPNIILFFIDDWAWNGTSVQMDDEIINSYLPSLISMPNLDKIAAEGMIFSNAYSGAPQCSPSRVALQTGQSSPRNGFTVYMNSNGDYYDNSNLYKNFPLVPCVSDAAIDRDVITIPMALASYGYTSAHLGKWHAYQDESIGYGMPGDIGFAMNDGNTDNKSGHTADNDGNPLTYDENGGYVGPENPKRIFSITNDALSFITQQVNANKPFYAQLSHYAMHEGRDCLPWTRAKYQAMPELQRYYKSKGTSAEDISYRSDPAVWLGMAENLDSAIGVVLDSIKELGIEDNTYVIVTSDNGYREDFYEDLMRLPQPLRAHKWWLWQAGIRVAMVVKGPNIPAGSVCDENVVNYDFLPTFVDWAGGDTSALTGIDGVSLASLMKGETATEDFSNRNLFFHYPHYRDNMPHSAMISGSKKVMHFYEKPDLPILFDLANDMGETVNIADTDPVTHKTMYDDMMKYLNDVGARIPKINPDYDPAVYASAREYTMRMKWGPFEGERKLDEDEIVSPAEKLYQHLSALNKASISVDAAKQLTAWSDQSYNNNNAVTRAGNPIYPSVKTFESGLAGIDFGSSNNTLDLILSGKSDAIVDFNGAAANNSGFGISVAFIPLALNNEWCYLLGNSSNTEDVNSFGIRYNGSGIVEAYLGGERLTATKAISLDKTSVVVLNYNKYTGEFTLFTTAGDTISKLITSGDFSNASAVFFGGNSSDADGYFNGVLGEIKVYDMALTDEQVYEEGEQILKNWSEPGVQKLIQHLDATVEGSIERDQSGLVSVWKDLSGNQNDATAFVGSVFYPSSSASKVGLKGLDFGDAISKLKLFSSDASDSILDFTGLAAKNNGVTFFMAFKIDDFVANHNDIMGNSTTITTGLGLRYSESGQPVAYTGGSRMSATNSLQKDETVVYALKFDRPKQLLEFWNSSGSSITSITSSLASGDFSNGDAFTIGGTGNSSSSARFFIGMVGEVKVYNYSLSDAKFDEEFKYLTDKWINGFPPSVTWMKNPFSKTEANVDVAYTDSIIKTDLNNPENKEVQFSKVSGPAWLSISTSGKLTGTPSISDSGLNSFLVQVIFEENTTLQAKLEIEVLYTPSVGLGKKQPVASIYPNPVHDMITISEVSQGHFMIYDIYGIKRMEGNLKNSIDITGLKSGLYNMLINDQVVRFIKIE